MIVINKTVIFYSTIKFWASKKKNRHSSQIIENIAMIEWKAISSRGISM